MTKINNSTLFEDTDHQSEWLTGDRLLSLIKKVNKLESLNNKKIISLASRILLSSSNIYKVIFGIRNISHLERLFDLRDSQPLENDIRKKYLTFILMISI